MSVPSWNESLPTDAQKGASWWFATTFVERLSVNMRRLRLGGIDPILVADKAWQETLMLFDNFCNRNPGVSQEASKKGFQLVLCHHTYGPALVQLMQWRKDKSEFEDAGFLITGVCAGPCPFQGENKTVYVCIT